MKKLLTMSLLALLTTPVMARSDPQTASDLPTAVATLIEANRAVDRAYAEMEAHEHRCMTERPNNFHERLQFERECIDMSWDLSDRMKAVNAKAEQALAVVRAEGLLMPLSTPVEATYFTFVIDPNYPVAHTSTHYKVLENGSLRTPTLDESEDIVVFLYGCPPLSETRFAISKAMVLCRKNDPEWIAIQEKLRRNAAFYEWMVKYGPDLEDVGWGMFMKGYTNFLPR